MSPSHQPGPPRVQIQTQSGCNARCVFCPNGAVLHSDLPQGRMTPEHFQRLIDDLAQTPPRRVSPYLQNEPLLDRRLPDFIRYISDRIPKTTTLVTTNGTYLSEERGAALIDAGLKRIKVSIQSLDRETNMKIMGRFCDSDKIVQNVLALRRLIKEKRARRLDLRVSTVVTNANKDEIGEAGRFWRSHGIRHVISGLENRGGNIQNAETMNPGQMAARREACIRPVRELCVLYNGDAVLCCVDWFRAEIVGNVLDESVAAVWNGPRLTAIRRAFADSDPDALPEICINCTENASPNRPRRNLKGLLSRALTGRA